MKVSALVVDDEPIARHAVVRLLREDPDIAVAGECGDGVSAVAAIRDLSPDLVFLDIQMPAITGLDVVATIGAPRMPATIFVTAYEQFAVRAFDANAVDYLVKPFSRERFSETLRRAKQRLAAAPGTDADTTTRIMQALPRCNGGRTIWSAYRSARTNGWCWSRWTISCGSRPVATAYVCTWPTACTNCARP